MGLAINIVCRGNVSLDKWERERETERERERERERDTHTHTNILSECLTDQTNKKYLGHI